jgi:hypothetical protein
MAKHTAIVILDTSRITVDSVPCQLMFNAVQDPHVKTGNVDIKMENHSAIVTMDIPRIMADSVSCQLMINAVQDCYAKTENV